MGRVVNCIVVVVLLAYDYVLVSFCHAYCSIAFSNTHENLICMQVARCVTCCPNVIPSNVAGRVVESTAGVGRNKRFEFS